MNTIKKVLAIVAVANLIALFIFDYRLPFFSAKTSNNAVTSADANDTSDLIPAGDVSLHIQVPDEAMTYDGTQELDLLREVVVVDDAGEELSGYTVDTEIMAGSSALEKNIVYSINTGSDTLVTAERLLILTDTYAGPSIEIMGSMPVTSPDEIEDLAKVLISGNLIQAVDGFGNDITSMVTASVKSGADETGNIIVTLTVTNVVNDSFSTDVTIPTAQHGPVVKLLSNQVTLSVGDSFSIYNYIDYARAEDGTDLSNRISVDGHVDTSTPGEYVLEFYCSDTEGNISKHEKLTVTVQ